MASFIVLTGKDLTKAIKGFGAKVSTFSALQHQLAYSALNHAEEHHCASHLNNLFAVTPLNYRAALRVWASDLGKVKFVAEPTEAGQHFAYDKGSKSDLPKALDISPADYARAEKAGAERAFDELKALESFLAKLEEKGASVVTRNAIEGAIRLLKTAAPKAAKPVSTRKPKGPKLVSSNPAPAADFIGPVQPVAIAA